MRPFRYGAQGLRWCLRRQAARDSRVSGGAVASKALGLRMCSGTFGRHHRKTRSTARHPRFAQGVGGHPGCVLFNAAGGGPTLLPILAPRRGTWSTSRCRTAAVEVVGWVMGPGLFFWGQDGGGGLGPPPNTRLLPHTFGGGRINPINSGPSFCEGACEWLLRFLCGGLMGPHG